MKKFLLITLLALSQFMSAQDNGTLKGLLTDKEANNQPLPFANIIIKGTTIGTTSDFDGNYALKVPAGNHTVVFSFLGYKSIEKAFSIKEGETVIINQILSAEEGVALDDVVIKASSSKEKVSALILDQKKSVSIKTSIGAQELATKGVSDAEGAVTKTAGVSKGDKNVVVRGLGDRYNATTMNGLPLPSDDPEYKNISLNFFDTNIIKNVGINKVFTADLSGDVGGASIDIVSKEVVKRREAGLGFSLGANTQTVSKDFLTIDGDNKFGTQKLNHSITDLNTYSFSNSFKPHSQNFQLNSSFNLKYGRKYDVGADNTLSFFVVASYDAKYSFLEGNIKQNTTNGSISPFKDQNFSKYNFNVSQMFMGNVKFKSDTYSIAYNHLFIHNNKQSIGDYFGKNDPQQNGDLEFQRRQQTNNNELYVNQFLGDYAINDRLKLVAKGSLNFIRGNEPDRRTNKYLLRGGFYNPQTNSAGENERYFSRLQENDYAAKAKLSFKLKEDEEDKSSIDLGADFRSTERLFEATIFNHGFSQRIPIDINNPDAVFNQQSLDNKVFIMETGRGRNVRVFDPFTYHGQRLVTGVFSNLVYQFTKNLIVSGGLKFERNHQKVTYDTNIASSSINGPSEIDRSYVLPSVNLKYNFNENSIFRIAASQTYTFPQFKETAPFKYQDVNFSSQGNPDLKPSDNYNIDTKYEYYFSSSELISLTGFYKYIQNPIARSEIPSGGNTLTYLNVGKDASVYGLEFETRKNVLKSNDAEENEYSLNAGLNASLLFSKVNLDSSSIAQFQQASSQLEGATPFLMNADVTFNKKYTENELTSSLVFNYFSNRVYSIGTRGFENIIEKGIPTLDLVSSLKLGKRYRVKLKASNILNPSFQLSRVSSTGTSDVVLSNYKKGVNLSLGFSYDF